VLPFLQTGLSISGPSPYRDLHWGGDQPGFSMADVSVGSVLQIDVPHDHRKAFSGEVWGKKWVLAYPM